MKRHGKILEYALSSLLRRKYKNLGLIVVFCLVVAVLASVLLFTGALKQEAVTVLGSSPGLIVQKLSGGRHDLIPLDYGEKIKKIPGIGKVVPRYWGYYYDYLTKANYTLLAIGEDTEGLQLLTGKIPTTVGECAVGQGVAQAAGINLGDELVLADGRGDYSALKVTGIFTSKSILLTNDLVVMVREQLLTILDQPPDLATDLVVEVFNEAETSLIAKKIKLLLPGARPITRKEIIRTYETVFNWRSGMVLTMFLGALIAFCILAWEKAAGLSAEEGREIGILKAIGWETSDILELKFWEGAVISLTSFLSGLIIAYLHVFYFRAALLAPALKGWSVIFPRFDLIPYVDLYQIIVMLFLTVVPYTACTIVPSWKAAITDPDIVMRG